jgi:hypothetical protein
MMTEQKNTMMATHEDIMFYAFRYALGRNTYAVDEVIEYIISNISDISTPLLNVMLRDISRLYDKYPNSNKEWRTLELEIKKIVNADNSNN